MNLWEYTAEELSVSAEIRSDMFLAPEIEMPWESGKIERIVSMPIYATAPATGHNGLADQVLLERDGDGWKCVGHYIDEPLSYFGECKILAYRTSCSFAVWNIATSRLSRLLLMK